MEDNSYNEYFDFNCDGRLDAHERNEFYSQNNIYGGRPFYQKRDTNYGLLVVATILLIVGSIAFILIPPVGAFIWAIGMQCKEDAGK